MSENTTVKKMWNDYLNSINESSEKTDLKYTSWHFCNNKEDANSLYKIVLKGVKRATASLYLSYEHNKEEIPNKGSLSIITDWDENAKCIIQTTAVKMVPYNEVTEEFAAKEGEGDKSLKFWKRVHWKFFSEEMEEIGKEPIEDMLVVCEEFKVVFK